MSAAPYLLTDITEGLLTTIKSGLSTPVSTYTLPDAVGNNLPAIAVEPVMSDFAVDFARGSDTWEFLVYVLVSVNHLPTAVKQLSQFVTGSGPDSVRQALWNHPDLGIGGTVPVQAVCHGMHAYAYKFPWYGTAHIGAALLVRVYVN